MKINKINIWILVAVLLGSIWLGAGQGEVIKEMNIFRLKFVIVLVAIALCVENKNEEEKK